MSNQIKLTGGWFAGFQRKPYVNRETGEQLVSKRLKVQFEDAANSTEDEFATTEIYFRVPRDLEDYISGLKLRPMQKLSITAAIEQDKAHEDFRLRLLDVEKVG
jgi:hypothetical protein